MALINQLVPESKPNATYLSPTNRTFNCQSALLAAHMHLDIPRIISYDVMLDLGKSNEMAMCFLTYLSYFGKPIGAAFLSWVEKLVPSIPIKSFENLSTDGRYFLALMEACHPGCCPEWEMLSAEDKKGNMEKALQVANTKLGIHIEMEELQSEERRESKTLLFVAKIKASTTSKSLPVSKMEEKHGEVGECLSQLLPTEYMGLYSDIEITRLDEEILNQIPLIEVSLNPESRQAFLEITFTAAGYYGVTVQPSKCSFPFIVAALLQYTVRVKGSDICGKCIGQVTHPSRYKHHFKVSSLKASHRGITCTAEPTASISTAMASEPGGTCTDNLDNANATDATSNKILEHPTNLEQRNEMENGNPVVANNENEDKFLKASLKKIDPAETVYNEELNNQQGSMQDDEQEPGDTAASEEINHMHEEHGGQEVSESEDEVKKEGEYQDDEFSQSSSSDDSKQDMKSEQSPMEEDAHLLTPEEGVNDTKKADEVFQGMERPILDTEGVTVVVLSELKRVIVNKPITFQIHAHRAGLIEDQTMGITVRPLEQVHGINGSLSDVSIVHTDNGDGTYLVTCTIPSTGAYQVAILYEGEHVSESPYTLQAFSAASLCRAYGEVIEKSKRLMVGRQVKFYVDSTEAGDAHMTVSVSDPALNEVKASVSSEIHSGKQVHSIEFTPKKVGDHTAAVEWNDTPIPGSPFQFKMVNPSKVQVHNLPASGDCVLVVSQPFCFTINKSMAGEGAIKAISHLSNGGSEEFELQSSENGKIIARYVPSRKGQMDLELTFVTVRILQHPWTCDIVDPASVTLSTSSLYCEKKKEFKLRISGFSDHETKYLTMDVIPPQGKSPLIHFDGIETAVFTPVTVGEYFVIAKLAGESVKNSPLKVLAVSPSACRLGRSIPHLGLSRMCTTFSALFMLALH